MCKTFEIVLIHIGYLKNTNSLDFDNYIITLVLFYFLISQTSKCPEVTKPMLIFAGGDFDVTEDYRRLKNLLIGKCQ